LAGSCLSINASETSVSRLGDLVKICAHQERFWAEVIAKEGDVITARVDNHLLMWQLKYNDIITFRKENVYNIMRNVLRIKKSVQLEKKPRKRKGKGLKEIGVKGIVGY